jgi:hypothetical protein
MARRRTSPERTRRRHTNIQRRNEQRDLPPVLVLVPVASRQQTADVSHDQAQTRRRRASNRETKSESNLKSFGADAGRAESWLWIPWQTRTWPEWTARASPT